MRDTSYVLSESDIGIILYSLSIFPAHDFLLNEKHDSSHTQNCLSAIEKIADHAPQNLTSDEFYMVYSAIKAAQLIGLGFLESDLKTQQSCSSYLFSINKISSVLKKML